jgi:sarcosine oxidase subunit gamma
MLNRENTIQSLKNNKFKDFKEKHSFIQIQELPFVKKINLRLDPNDKICVSSCSKILDTVLPTKANTYSKNTINEKVIWLGPDEWLIVSDDDTFMKLQNKLEDLEVSVTDVSENRTIIRIRGRETYILLSKFLVLDLEKNLSTDSSCAQTLFVKVPVLLVRNN